MLRRTLETKLLSLATQYPVVTLTGPRQSGQTIASDFSAGLRCWLALAGRPDGPAALVYGGETSYVRSGVSVYAWEGL